MFCEDSDSDDDWFYNSIKRYNDLLMYDLQGIVTASVFSADDKFVTAVSRGSSHEILELDVPEKLITNKDAGLTKDRDFQMTAAGYTNSEVSQIMIKDNQIITSEADGIYIYQSPIDKQTDVINFTEKVLKDVRFPYFVFENDVLYTGITLSEIKCINLINGHEELLKIICEGKELKNISTLNRYNNELYLCLEECGSIILQDIRVNKTICVSNESYSSKALFWQMDTCKNGIYFGLGNSLGEITIKDKRFLSKDICHHNAQNFNNDGKPCVLFNPTSTCLSYTNNKPTIEIFDFIKSKETNLNKVFLHDGHRKKCVSRITCHLWHPTHKGLVFSCDDVCQLQAWKYR